MRVGVHVALCVVGGVLLSGCGGGGASTTTVTSSAASAASTASSGTVTQPSASTTSPPSRPATPPRSSAHLSAAAKGFLVTGADNSIVEYGQEAGGSARAQVQAVLASFLRARARGEWARACTALTAGTREQLERLSQSAKARVGATAGNCSRALRAFSGGPAADRADPLAGGALVVRIKGSVAFALFHGPHASEYVMTMHSEGGAWKVSQIAPEPYPLGVPGVAP
jgi:hypothetical protein